MPFDDIPPDKEATFKQYRAVAYKFASFNDGLVPGTNLHQLAKIIQGAMWGFHQANKKPLTHAEVQNFFDNPVMPDYYIKAIKLKPKLTDDEEGNVENSKVSLLQKLKARGIKQGTSLSSLASKNFTEDAKEKLSSSLKNRGIKKGESLESLASKKNKALNRIDW